MAHHSNRRTRRSSAPQRGVLAALLSRAASQPIRDCCTNRDLWENGLGTVLISRQLADENVAFAMFLVDRYCLGVKSAFGNVIPGDVYEHRLCGPFRAEFETVNLAPAAARKLLAGAVQYAGNLGFPPDPRYDEAMAIFGEIDPAQCSDTWEYGKNGKPHFVAGPTDTRETCQRIMRTLERACGKDGYDFTVPFAPEDWTSMPEGSHLYRYNDAGEIVEVKRPDSRGNS